MSTEIKIFQLALERLMEEVEELKAGNKQLRIEVDELKDRELTVEEDQVKDKNPEKLLLNTKEVQQILGVCYNTLQKVVSTGKLKPIKIGQRRIRYSKVKLIEYLENEQQDKIDTVINRMNN